MGGSDRYWSVDGGRKVGGGWGIGIVKRKVGGGYCRVGGERSGDGGIREWRLWKYSLQVGLRASRESSMGRGNARLFNMNYLSAVD